MTKRKQDAQYAYDRFMYLAEQDSLTRSFQDVTQYDDDEWHDGQEELEDIVSASNSYIHKADEVIARYGNKTDEALAAKTVKSHAKILKTFANEKLKIKDWAIHAEELTFVAAYQDKCSYFFRLLEVKEAHKATKKM